MYTMYTMWSMYACHNKRKWAGANRYVNIDKSTNRERPRKQVVDECVEIPFILKYLRHEK